MKEGRGKREREREGEIERGDGVCTIRGGAGKGQIRGGGETRRRKRRAY